MDKQILNAVKNLEQRTVDLYKKVKKLGETPIVPQVQVTKVLKTTITTAQVLNNLGGNGVVILNNDDPLTIKTPISLYIRRNAGVAYETTETNLWLYVVGAQAGSSVQNYTLITSPLKSPLEGFISSSLSIILFESGDTRASSYKLQMNNKPTLGTGDLDVYVTYTETTL